MEWWATVIIVVASNIVIGAVSIFTARMQINHSHKQWFRELKSEPLLTLKNELATIATKYESVFAAYSRMVIDSIPVKEAGEAIIKNVEDFLDYAQSGEWSHILFMIYDLDIKNNVNEIIDDYRMSSLTILSIKSIESENKEKWENAMNVSRRNNARMEQVQLMIDNKLGEL